MGLNKNLDNILSKEQNISRRDMLKMASAIALVGNNTNLNAKTNQGLKPKIVIIGAGLAGMAVASSLSNKLSSSQITMIEPNQKQAQYQEGQTLVASGIWTSDDIYYNKNKYISSNIKMIYEKAIEFYPDENFIITDNGTKIKYDFLVVTAGLKLNFSAIKGLEEIEEAYSIGNNTLANKVLNSMNISCAYTLNTAVSTWNNIQNLLKQKNINDLNCLFTIPNTKIKALGVTYSMMNMLYARFKEESLQFNPKIQLYTSRDNYLPRSYDNDLMSLQFNHKNIKTNFNHTLLEVKKNKAIFTNKIKKDFDFLHIVPPMKAPDEIGKSKIGSKNGWVPVNKETLQHIKYENIFSLGDIIDTQFGKTASSIRKQYPIVVDNIISMVNNNEIQTNSEKYNGYTNYSILTGIGSSMNVEFDWSKKTYKNSMIPHYKLWLYKLYLAKISTLEGLVKARF